MRNYTYEPEPTKRCPFSKGRFKVIWDQQVAEGRQREAAERRAAKGGRGRRNRRDSD